MPSAPYRAPLPVPPDPYLVAWATIRRRQRVRRVGSVASVVWMAGVLIASDFFDVQFPPSPIAWVLPAFALSLALRRWVSTARCPRCRLKSSWQVGWHEAKACKDCGIAVGTPKAAIVEAEKRAADVTGAGADVSQRPAT